MTTSAAGIGTGSDRRGGGGVLATPVSGFVHELGEASSDRRTDGCPAGSSAQRMASAKKEECPQKGTHEEGERSPTINEERDEFFDENEEYFESTLTSYGFEGDTAMGLGMIPEEETTRLFGDTKARESTEEETAEKGENTMRLRGGGRNSATSSPSPERIKSVEKRKKPTGKHRPGPKFLRDESGSSTEPPCKTLARENPEEHEKQKEADTRDEDGQDVSSNSSADDEGSIASRGSRGMTSKIRSAESKTEPRLNTRPADKATRGTISPTVVISSDEDTSSKRSGRKKGRPPTTAEYMGKTAALKKLNEEKERLLQLSREEAARNMSVDQLIKIGRIDMYKKIEEMEKKPDAEIAKKMEDCQAEVLKIARTSANLKGTYQKALKGAAVTTLAGLQVINERVERMRSNAISAEIEALRNELAELRTRLEGEQAEE